MASIFDFWECELCQGQLGWLCKSCVYCDVYGIHSTNPDINNLINRSEATMTPQEELFKELFNHEKKLVSEMDTLSLRAHREELAKIAFEARARLSAVDDEEKVRKPKKSDKGFQTSINGTDDVTSDAINTVKERQARMSKSDKILAGLEKLGISNADAQKIMSAGAIKGRLDAIKPEEKKLEEQPKLFNPFEKKES